MADIKERLDLLKQTIQEDDFLQGKGLSNEVNIRMFCYNPKDEMVVRDFTERLKSQQLKCNVQIVDLFELLIDICKEKRILDRIPKLEAKKGQERIEQYFKKNCNEEKFSYEIMNQLDENSDLILITGVGKVYPFLRAHNLLNTLQEKNEQKKPIVVLYPGAYDGHYVKLFNQLNQNEYYRAFNII